MSLPPPPRIQDTHTIKRYKVRKGKQRLKQSIQKIQILSNRNVLEDIVRKVLVGKMEKR